MSKAVLRIYIPKNKVNSNNFDIPHSHERVFVFDTETTTDEFQNLKFGSFGAYFKDILEHIGIFYNLNCVNEKELRTLKKYCDNNDTPLYETAEFVEKVLYPQIYELKALCIGFNLPFDISRIAIDYGYCRGSMNGGFSFKLNKNNKFPRIKVKHIDSSKSFIEFGRGFKGPFKGYFLDLKTLTTALTDSKHISLEKACEAFKTEHRKIKAGTHGKITEKYIEYNLNDVLATYELYLKLKEELDRYGIRIPITKVFSSASLGKALLRQLGIKPFLEMNPKFPSKILGYLMSSFYGGRSEVRIRKEPVKVTVIDFLSMYPTMFILLDLWNILVAEKIETYDDTENVKKMVNSFSIEDLKKPETWKRMNVLVQIKSNDDILPLRMNYGDEETFNIGLNHVKSDVPMFYALPDIVASIILTGKKPQILKAIRFIPKGLQGSLKKVNIIGMEIDPRKENLFKLLIEERQRCKDKGEKSRQKALKILSNATSYGIYAEINAKSAKSHSKVDVYSNEMFTSEISKIEENAEFFNPIIAVMITAGSRLVLAITEALLKRHNAVHAFCDTDSMAVPIKSVEEIQRFFKLLNPYSFDKLLFKVEHSDVWFYGISAKRYVLFKKQKNCFLITDEEMYSLHGLGHLTNPFGKGQEWQKTVWEDILRLHYGLIDRGRFLAKYGGFHDISQLTVSTYRLLQRFRKLNQGKPYENQIKPFSFFLVGMQNKAGIKPISAYSDNPQKIVYEDFIDYETRKILKGTEYWKPLSDTLWEYVNHKESKMDGNIGVLERKHVNVDGIIHIGKETNNIENTGILEAPKYEIYQNNEELKKKIMGLTPKDARAMGLNEETLRRIKKRIREGGGLNLYKKAYSKLGGT